MKEPIVVVCPGRGTYTKQELGYLTRHGFANSQQISRIDGWRRELSQKSVTELDSASQFSVSAHLAGENAAALIYACSLSDFLVIHRERFEVVAITGNSMGWYSALALGGALDEEAGFRLINTMGSMMASGVIGAQLIYPVTNEQWRRDPKKVAAVAEAMGTVNGQLGESLYPSIHFGGYEVIGGTAAAVEKLAAILPKVDNRYPMILPGHAAFHTPVLQSVSKKALELLPSELFRAPAIPLIDGRGHVWQPLSTDSELLREYTLGHQVVETYDFTAAVTVALKEFAPAKLVLLGPGSTSGGAIGQILVELRWKGIDSKEVFAKFQAEEPFLLAMGLDEQRARLVPETA